MALVLSVASSALDALVLADLHYVREANHVCPIEKRQSALGPVLLRGAFRRLQDEGIDVGAIIILGDVVDNGLADGAELDLAAVAEEARALGVPVLAVPGNHDGDFERFARIWECQPGLHEVCGYGFLVFHDHIDAHKVTIRTPQGIAYPAVVASERPGLPMVALQHNPLDPHIESDYPFMLTNADEVLSGYQDAGMILSLSGHYHPGQAAHRVGDCVGGMICYTAPAICEDPFRFAHVRLRGREVEVYGYALGDIV